MRFFFFKYVEILGKKLSGKDKKLLRITKNKKTK